MRQDVLFYSKFCEYSGEVVNLLNKKGARDEFTLVCIDTIRNKLPHFVDRVPLIYTIEDMIIYDDGILQYIERKYPSLAPEEISPFSLEENTVFSFLGGNETDDEMHKKFTLLGQEQKIIMSKDDSNKKDKLDSAAMERYMQDREIDDKNFKQTLKGPAIR